MRPTTFNYRVVTAEPWEQRQWIIYAILGFFAVSFCIFGVTKRNYHVATNEATNDNNPLRSTVYHNSTSQSTPSRVSNTTTAHNNHVLEQPVIIAEPVIVDFSPPMAEAVVIDDPENNVVIDLPADSDNKAIDTLRSMGFETERARDALRASNNNVERAANRLVGSGA